MKTKFYWLMFSLFIFLFLFTENSFASGFYLKSIGSVETGGQQISQWWYTGTNPVFHGEATPGAEVVATVDGTAQSINADSSGMWDYSAGVLTAGDHEIKFSSGGSDINFTLTIGTENVNWDAVGSGSAATMPAAGTTTPTIILLVFGLGLAVMGGKMVFNVNKE